jgi:Tfp pilus assembly protein PilX
MQPIRLLKHDRRGSVLIVGLFTLALLSLLGAAATTTSRTDVSITGNNRTLQEAFYAAEVGLAMGEMKIDQMASLLQLKEEMPTGYYGIDEHPNWDEMNWNDGDSALIAPFDLSNGLDHLYELPRYTVALLKRTDKDRAGYSLSPKGSEQSVHNLRFKIYAKGTGGSSKTRSVVQSIFVKRFN